MKLYFANGEGYLSNTYVVVDESSGEAAVFDPGVFSDELKSILNNGEIKSLKYILLTHGHYDHILGVYDLKQSYPDAVIAISEEDAVCLTDPRYSFADHCEKIQTPIASDVLVKDGDIINVGCLEFKVMSTPGHTRGCVCYICDSENIMISGDTLFHITVGRTDFPGSSWESMENSLKRLMALEQDYNVYPGHNRDTTLFFEKTHNRYMRHL